MHRLSHSSSGMAGFLSLLWPWNDGIRQSAQWFALPHTHSFAIGFPPWKMGLFVKTMKVNLREMHYDLTVGRGVLRVVGYPQRYFRKWASALCLCRQT